MKPRAEFIAELTDIVKTDKIRWKDDAFDRAADTALLALSVDRPIVEDAELQLINGQRKYLLPTDCLKYLDTDWGDHPHIEPWSLIYPGPLPRIYMENSAQGKKIVFSKSPTAMYLAAYGSNFVYQYCVNHQLTEDTCTLLEEDYELFITRAMAVLMKDLIALNVTTPIQLHRGMGNMGSMPSNSTPVAAYEMLMTVYKDLLC